jgi:hypothetical protein
MSVRHCSVLGREWDGLIRSWAGAGWFHCRRASATVLHLIELDR